MMNIGNDLLKREIVRAELLLLAKRIRECEARLEAGPADAFAALELRAGVDAMQEYIRELRELDRRLAHILRGVN